MKVTKKTTYTWWMDTEDEIPENHKDELREHAEDHIIEMMKEGCECGELATEIDDEYYQGWWDIEEETEES